MRKEKYIKVKTYKGNTYYTVQFFYGSKWDRHSYSKTFNSADYDSPAQALKEACRHRDIKRAELLTSGLPTRKMTVNDAYEASKKVFARAETTELKWDKYYEKYFEEYLNTKMEDVTDWTITAHLESLRTNKTDVVIYSVFSLWKRICKTAKGMRAISVNPTDTVVPPKSSKHIERRKQDFTDEEVEKVISALLRPTEREDWAYNRYILSVMIKVARFTGLRPREIKYLEREDIDFATATLHVRPHGKNVKNQSAIRSIPMNKVVQSELLTLCSISPYSLPFMFYGGLVPASQNISCMLRSAEKTVGVKGFHLYGMRHSFDSELITNGVDPRTVMELMGHTNVNTTLATYARSTEQKRKEAIELVEDGRKLA